MFKKHIFLLIGFIVFINHVNADWTTLIDFGLLQRDIHISSAFSNPDKTPNQNENTLIDFPLEDGSSVKMSLSLNSWGIYINDRSVFSTFEGIRRNRIGEASSRDFGRVLGAQIAFPGERAAVDLRPPFTIPLEDSRFENGYGLLRDERGIILASVSIRVYSVNYPVRLKLSLILDNDDYFIIDFGILNFDGWGELRWNNPRAIQEVRNKNYIKSIRFDKFIFEPELVDENRYFSG